MKRPWEISRRACLRGAGTAIGLPLLEAMIPGVERARAAGGSPPKRLVFFIFSGGTPETTGTVPTEGRPGCLRPSSSGPNYETTPLLQPLIEKHGLKQDILVVSDLHNRIGEYGTEPKHMAGDHPRSAAAILTGVNPEYADDDNAKAGISIDQFAASKLKAFTPALPSLVLGTVSDPNIYFRYCWSGPASPVWPISKPSEAFAKVYGVSGVDPKILRKQFLYRKRVLDAAKSDYDRLRKKLGSADQQRLEQYLTSVSDLESQVMAQSTSGDQCGKSPLTPDDAPSMPARLKQMLDLVPLAFQCDRTRVATVQIDSHRAYFDFLGSPCSDYPVWHDDVEHGAGAAMSGFDDVKQRAEAYVQGAAWQIEQFGYLVRKLRDTPEGNGGGSLLDNSVLVCTSEISYGNGHIMSHLPVIVAGRGGGAVTTGKHVSFGAQPITNLYLAMLQAVGIEATSFGESSTGAVSLT